MMQMDCANMMSGAGGIMMMAGMGLLWLLLLAVLLLATAALVKYLRSGRSSGTGRD